MPALIVSDDREAHHLNVGFLFFAGKILAQTGKSDMIYHMKMMRRIVI